jgi:hypothetical protein
VRTFLLPLLVVSAPILPILALFRVMPRPPRLDLAVDGDTVVVAMHGCDVFFCMRARIVVPIAAVDGVCVSRRDLVPHEGLRLPGTSLGKLIRAGSYGVGAARDFWNVRRAESVLVIQLCPGAEYRRIVLEVPDPGAEALRLRPILGPTTLPLLPVL